MSLSIVVLAAGEGTRMRSAQPKVLADLGGQPLLWHVLEGARALAPRRMSVVVGAGAEAVREALEADDVTWVTQAQRLGTGHAVQQALPAVASGDTVLVLYGDVPLVSEDTLRRLVAAADGSLALLTAITDAPEGYGRIVRNADNAVTAIVEQRDASPEQRSIREINTGLMAAPADLLGELLQRVGNRNAQGEYYLTDVVSLAVAGGHAVTPVIADNLAEVAGVNDREQLAAAERRLQQRHARQLMHRGVTLRDPARYDQRGSVVCGTDTTIDVNVVFEGRVTLGARVRIGAHCHLRDCELGDDVEVLPFSHLDGVRAGHGVRIGPYARVRPGTVLADDSRVGNFVEIKQSDIGAGSKINHLSYVGDAALGSGVNIGAGTITCNYDGANKHRTVIGDDVFVGSDTQLVAPVKVGDGATIGAGSTITRDAPAGQLTVTRTRQTSLAGWRRPRKRKDQ